MDDPLDDRLHAAQARVLAQRRALRDVMRRSHERSAAASERSDRATTTLLRAQGAGQVDPPVPSRPPEWLDDGQ